MPEGLSAALATPGAAWLALTIAIAGIVRGFTGFGTALIFVPVAGLFLPPAKIVLLITLTGVASTAALLPRAWGEADRGEVGLLALAAALTVPAGVWALGAVPETALRWIVTGVAAATLAAVATGWRYHARLRAPGLAAIGGAAGVVGGMTGLTGPVVILFYLASTRAARAVRANTILFLAILDVVIVANLALRGLGGGAATVWLAALLALPYFATTLLGQRLFDPERERLYRRAAYGVIALAVITGAPVFDG